MKGNAGNRLAMFVSVILALAFFVGSTFLIGQFVYSAWPHAHGDDLTRVLTAPFQILKAGFLILLAAFSIMVTSFVTFVLFDLLTKRK